MSMSGCNTINYVPVFLAESTGQKIGSIIKTLYLNLVNMQTDNLREHGLCMMASKSQ